MQKSTTPSEFKRGLVLVMDGNPHILEEYHASGTAQTKPKLHARLRNLKTGRVIDHVFTDPHERVLTADLE